MNNQASKFRIYYYFLLGMVGGLTGWFLTALSFRGANDLAFLNLVGRGILIGSLIGLSVAAYDGFSSRTFRRFYKLGRNGLLLGVVSGGFALPLTQWIFSQLWPTSAAQAGARLIVGTICWTIFGGIIGFVEVLGKGTQSYKGLLGGICGGIFGGGVYEIARHYGYIGNSDSTQVAQAFCLALMGGFIAISIALVSTLLRQAWVEVLDGKFAGHAYDVTKYVSKEVRGRGLIGSDEFRANIYLPADNGVLEQHAILCYTNQAPTLLLTPEAQKLNPRTLVNGYPVSSCPLSDGDKIEIGTTSLLYHQKR